MRQPQERQSSSARPEPSAREDALETTPNDRRRLLKFLAGSPLLLPAAVATSAWQTGQRLDPIIDAASQALDVFDFEAVARERLPAAHFGYLATGSDDDGTIKANREGFTRFQLRVPFTRTQNWRARAPR